MTRIAIIGAGPAGLAVAIELARLGHELSIFEKMQDLSAQGSGVLIQPIGLLALDLLGLRAEVERQGRRIDQIKGYSTPLYRTSVSVNYKLLPDPDYAIGIDRNALWQILYDKATALGLEVNSGISVTKLSCKGSGEVSLLAQSDNGCNDQSLGVFSLVVDASGANSTLRSYAAEPIKSRCHKYGALWAKLTVDDSCSYNAHRMTLYSDSLNIGLGLLPTGKNDFMQRDTMTLFFNLNWRKWDAGKFRGWKENALKKWPSAAPLISQLHDADQLYLARYRQHTMSKPYADNIVYIGDAARASNPQLGQGVNMSLIDAVCLPWAITKAPTIETALSMHAKTRRWHVALYQSMSVLLTPFYQSDSPAAIRVRELLYPLLSKLQIAELTTAYLVSGRMGWPLRRFTEDELTTYRAEKTLR